MNRKPDFFLVGAPKCGTTAMSHYLGAHPDIFTARKEMHFFGKDLHFEPQFYRRDEAAYLAEFEDWKSQRRGGEASVWYLFSRTAPAEIKAFNPQARIIIMLREPVEMLYSLYNSFLWDGNEHLPTFEDAIAAQADRRNGKQISRRTYFPAGLIYNEVVQFEQQVRRYFETFGRERVHVIIYDDFASDIAGVYRRALKFLDVDPTKCPATFNAVNRNKSVKSKALQAFFADPMVRSAVLAIRPMLPRTIFNAMQKVDARIRKFNSRPVVRQGLDPAFRDRLKLDFAFEVERLSELLRRDLTHWTHDYRSRRVPISTAAGAGHAVNSRDNLAA